MLVLELPFPVSTNALHESGRGRRYISAPYLKWKEEANKLLMAQGACRGAKKIFKDFAVSMVLDDSRFGKRDLDNTSKAVLDLLQDIELIEDDRWLKRLELSWGKTQYGCQVKLEAA